MVNQSSKDYSYSKKEKDNIYEFLCELRWEHSWYHKSFQDGVLQKQGLPINTKYTGLAQYCKCYKCRPDNFVELLNINDDRISNLLKNN